MTAPDQRPDGADPDLLAKVFPDDTGPLVSAGWKCGICGYSKPGGPPTGCQDSPVGHPDFARPDCPLGKPSL